MKKLEVIDTFECTPDEFWTNFLDPAFVAALDAEMGFTAREEIMVVDDADKFHTKFRITPKRELPPNIQMMLNNGLKMLQQVVNAGPAADTIPEPMKKMLEWGKSTFKDFLNRDPKSTQPAKPPPVSMTYVEEGVFDKHEKILRWTITPDLFKDVTSFRGTITVTPEGDGCRRVILGDVNLGIPGAGEMIETFLVEEIGRGHSKAAEVTRRWLAERKAGTR